MQLGLTALNELSLGVFRSSHGMGQPLDGCEPLLIWLPSDQRPKLGRFGSYFQPGT